MRRNDVKALLQEAGIRPRKDLGQNFCCDPQLIEALVRDAEIQPGELVVEVGTGTAALTQVLAKHASRVLSIEIDPSLHKLSKELLKDRDNVRLIHADALKNKNTLNPVVAEAINEELSADGIAGVRFVANLPYAVATPLIIKLLEDIPALRGITVLVQKEAAERMIATPGNKIYGAVSVLIAQWATGKVLRVVPREVFLPRPKVTSAVLALTPKPAAEQPDRERYDQLRRTVRNLFNSRRKTIAKAARIAAKADPSLAGLSDAIEACELDGRVRVEDLDPEMFRTLARSLTSGAERE